MLSMAMRSVEVVNVEVSVIGVGIVRRLTLSIGCFCLLWLGGYC